MSERTMTRCKSCGAQQTIACESPTTCEVLHLCGACDGHLEPFDWDAHFAKLPHVPMQPPTTKGIDKP